MNDWKRVSEIDWEHWRPVDVATLVFVIRAGEVLLIEKRRGLGAGKVNAPGGRLEPGETPLAAAIREVEEEVLVTPTDLLAAGLLRFQFLDGHSIHVHVFRAAGALGEPGETAEALPFWCPLGAIPYERMWEDDRHWLPLLLAGVPFDGRFLFDDDRMVDFSLDPGVAPGGA